MSSDMKGMFYLLWWHEHSEQTHTKPKKSNICKSSCWIWVRNRTRLRSMREVFETTSSQPPPKKNSFHTNMNNQIKMLLLTFSCPSHQVVFHSESQHIFFPFDNLIRLCDWSHIRGGAIIFKKKQQEKTLTGSEKEKKWTFMVRRTCRKCVTWII